MNRFNVDCASPGFCSLCYCEVAEFEGFIKFGESMRPKVTMLKSNFRQAQVELSDGTFMNVTLCDKCFQLTPEDMGKLYESEHRGWQREVDCFRTKLRKEEIEIVDKHLNVQAQKSIVNRADVPFKHDELKRISKPQIGDK